MDGSTILGIETWRPFFNAGLTHFFFSINKGTVIHTWMVLFLLFLFLILARYSLRFKKTVTYFATLSGVRSLMDLVGQTLGGFFFNHLSFIAALFVFILFCNSVPLIPWLEEPTRDINTTLALGIISFCYIQWFTIRAHGLGSYMKGYFSPFFLMFPLNVMGKISSVISLSFRLFGNVFGGAIIALLYSKLIEGSVILESIGLFSGVNFLILFFFGLFEGALQAFVFAMLSLTYLSMALQKE